MKKSIVLDFSIYCKKMKLVRVSITGCASCCT